MAKQSAAFKDLLSAKSKLHAEIGVVLHDLILDVLLDAFESVWPKQNIASYGIGPKKMSEHFVYIAFYRDHVNLGFYQGAEMQDPDRLLEGTGAGLRHIKIKDMANIKRRTLTHYIQVALQLRRGAE
jgi:hypothetical protein